MIRISEETAYTYGLPFIRDIRPYAHQAVQLQLVEKALIENKKSHYLESSANWGWEDAG